ncbi:ion transporter [Streptomyces indicus]|uniref:Voltage-gated sodium channel n=1 Tax=Streptomyces indicus TaxID=417292 RepID=A0A1G9AJM6_9ACTN|nr:ion transporter [Streptomyces indicus]SDK27527.1 voltage-gated sodium channel [Streptomyces indicus]
MSDRPAALARRCRALTEARWFAVVVMTLILVNAVLLGLETYSGFAAEWQSALRIAEHLCLAGFTVEILLRMAAHADRPRDFFRDPWNVFDLLVVGCAFLPVVSENTTLLRLLRLARVLRTARFLPQLRVVMVAVARSVPGTLSFLLVGGLLLYVYAMVGWLFFREADPGHFGSLGRALLTLLLLMTLDGLGDAVRAGLEFSRWTLLYYGAYVVMASFVLVNVLIGVVISSLEEAKELEQQGEEEARERAARGRGARQEDASGARGAGDAWEREEQEEREIPALRMRIVAARQALDELEQSLPGGRG